MKPGITISNTMTAVAGYFLAASSVGFEWMALIGVTLGVALVIASACVVNNIIDRDLDTKMKRTKGREIAAGNISLVAASVYAVILGVGGFLSLAVWTNWLTFGLGALAFVWYVVVYGIAKRTTPLSTIIGGVCGALPPVAGYTALTGEINATAWTLFILLMVWQLPHFYAISIFRRDDYNKAGLPVWSVRYGSASVKKQILFWIFAFAVTVPVLTILGATSFTYLVVMTAVSAYWLYQAADSYNKLDEEKWARKVFGISLIVLLTFSASIALGGYLP
jgi:protoheme IX farnesyltransferase